MKMEQLEITVERWLANVRLTLAAHVHLTANGDRASWVLSRAGVQTCFQVPQGTMSSVLPKLQDGSSLDELARLLETAADAKSVMNQLQNLWRGGCLEQFIYSDKTVVALLRAAGDTPLFPPMVQATETVTLGEDACIHRAGSCLLVESLEYGAVLQFNSSKYAGIVTALMDSTDSERIADGLGLPLEAVMPAVAWLVGIGAAQRTNARQQDGYERAGWSFADRLIHARSRMDRHVGGYGGTFPLADAVPEPPCISDSRTGPRIILEPPEVERILAQDLPFSVIMESRKSIRHHSEPPVTIMEVSEFLYRTARIKARFSVKNSEYIKRPFPSGGGLYELEFYLLVNRCEGIRPGFYHYDGLRHELEHITEPNPDTHRLMKDAVESGGITGTPNILVILSARFLRVNWKYESLAYSLILKHVGVVYQTMYLVANAMGLAPCALGGGSSVRFCRAAGTTYWTESSVGEFMLGKPTANNP